MKKRPATSVRPLRSIREMISPTRPRRTPSGFTSTSVRCSRSCLLGECALRAQVVARLARRVEAAEHEDEIVFAASSDRVVDRVRRRRRRSSTSSAPQPFRTFDETLGRRPRVRSVRSRHDEADRRRGPRSRAPRRSSFSDSIPTTMMSRSCGKASGDRRLRPRSADAGLCPPSTTTSGWRPRISIRPGVRTSAKPHSSASSSSASPTNASHGGDGERRVARLMLAEQREEHVVVGRRASRGSRRAGRRRPCTVERSSTSRPSTRHRRGALLRRARSRRSRTARPARPRVMNVVPSFAMPAFSHAAFARSPPNCRMWSSVTFVSDPTCASATFVASYSPPRPASSDGGVHRRGRRTPRTRSP